MIGRLVTLAPSERRLLAETLLSILRAWIALRFRRERVLSSLRAATRALPGAEWPPEVGAEIRWALAAVARRLPLARSCLVQAMAARELLLRRGCATRIVVGVARADDGRLSAHAWVEDARHRRVIGEDAEGRHAPLARADAGAASPPSRVLQLGRCSEPQRPESGTRPAREEVAPCRRRPSLES